MMYYPILVRKQFKAKFFFCKTCNGKNWLKSEIRIDTWIKIIIPARSAKTKRVTVTNKQTDKHTDRHTVRHTDCDTKKLNFENT